MVHKHVGKGDPRETWTFAAGSYADALDQYKRARSPFREGGQKYRKRVINVVPIVINAFFPTLLFSAIVFALTVSVHHRYPQIVEVGCVVAGLLPCAVLALMIRRNRSSFVPNWYKMALLLCLLAFFSAEAFGWYNYWYYMQPYYQLAQLQSYPNVDVSQVSGRHVQDAGRVYFAAGTHIDAPHSWHFKSGSLYCVAPLLGSAGGETTDFWVVGKDCCQEGAADFRCGEFENAKARSGLRVLEDPRFPERHFYNLAVKAAAAIFGLKAENPVFFTWVQDPLYIMSSIRDKGWSNLLIANMAFLAFNVLAVVLSTIGFSYLGRESKPLLEDEDDASFSDGGF